MRSVATRREGQLGWHLWDVVADGIEFPLGSRLDRESRAGFDDAELWRVGAEELAQHLQQERIAHFDVAPDWLQSPGTPENRSLDGSSWQQIGPGRFSLRVDLTKSEDEIFGNFRKNTRYEIRRAERAGVSVVSASSESEIDEFLTLHIRLAERKGFSPNLIEHMRQKIRWMIDSKSRGALLLACMDNCALAEW